MSIFMSVLVPLVIPVELAGAQWKEALDIPIDPNRLLPELNFLLQENEEISQEPQKPVVTPPPPAAKPNTLSERLRQLKRLRDEGLISEEEYIRKREALIDSL
jgi:hypothetical protein